MNFFWLSNILLYSSPIILILNLSNDYISPSDFGTRSDIIFMSTIKFHIQRLKYMNEIIQIKNSVIHVL